MTFRVHEPLGFIWGLPIVVPTCPRKMFEQGPKEKYVDNFTDTLHAPSSDLITWTTVAMIKTRSERATSEGMASNCRCSSPELGGKGVIKSPFCLTLEEDVLESHLLD